MRSFCVLILAVCLLPLSAVAAPPDAKTDLEARRKALNDLIQEQWEYTLRTNPEFASILGDKRYNDKVSDLSLKAIEDDLAETKKFLARFEAIDTTGFPPQEALNKQLMVRDLRNRLEDAQWKEWEMPITQISGIHLEAPQLVHLFPFDTVKDYEDFIARMRQFPKAMDQTMEHMRAGMRDNLMPPKFLLEKVVTQAENLAGQKPEESPFAQPLSKFPKNFSEADQARLRAEFLEVIGSTVLPAYARFAKFVKEEYAPRGRTEPGMWSLPDGAERYARRAKRSTTTDLTPEEIHQIGLREVARIEGEQLAIAKKLGYPDLKSFREHVKNDRNLYAKSRQQILDLYQKYTDQMQAKLPELFGRLPKGGMKIMPVEEFREKEAPGAQYQQGTPDGSRPGLVQVNTFEPEKRQTISMESTAYHEGLPGHHLQVAIGQELPALPPFRQQAFYGAFVEGWALYSERLGKEVGFYQDPYNDFGRLEDEMLRAIRLVVDTGFHYKKWTRDQVVQFFHDHSAIDEVNVQSETDRYIVWPGQALSYKIGQLTILKLREEAKKELGPKFDIRKFHDAVLGSSALPMDVLESEIHRWIAQEKSAAGMTSAGAPR
ncbi:MAG TPA: DUF885 domain-containing protein [Terriglobales bacterium]|nr:DUF885 domain-containing protein [Terriglobales bacterium]